METIYQKTKKKPTKVEEMTKEQIRQAIVKKRECNAKAQQIVESLLERNVTEKYLLQCLPDINQAHFEDIFEERSIIQLCGYPICQKTLSIKDIPKQKYRISLKTNKVYDITARKSFCSNTCYNAAMFVKKQLLTSPLWFREYEDIPTFHLLNSDTYGGMGEEIDVTMVDRVKIADKKSFTSINDFAQASLVDVPNDALNLEGEPLPTVDKSSAAEGNDLSTVIHAKSSNKSIPQLSSQQEHEKEGDSFPKEINITNKIENPFFDNITETNLGDNVTKLATQDESKASQKVSVTNKETEKVARSTNRNPLNIVGEIIEKPERKVDPILIATPMPNTPAVKKDFKKSKVLQKKQPMVTALTIEVEKCLAEWFTLDTMLLLFGDERVREMVADKGECIKEYLNNYSKGIFYSSNTYDQYQALCKKLNMLELEDRKFDNESKQDMRPLPNYSMLQEESKKIQLKVKAFLSGATDVPDPVIEETTDLLVSDEDKTTNLPLVDKNSQNALRRRIVCQYLNKVLPDLLRSLGLLSLQISADVRLLVNTFKLKANNIMFKPIQWTLIAIIFIKLLSIRDKRLEYLLEQPTAYKHMQLLLLSYKQDGGYLDRLICWLTDIDRLLDTDDTQLTVE